MLLNIIVAAVVLLVAYMWTAQGFFSALLHLMCTVVAGAIAFAVWEPLTYGLLLGLSPNLGWTAGLVLPFLVSLAVLRFGMDKLVSREPKMPSGLDFLGGGVCGAGSGVISAGVLMIGIGFMPVGAGFLGHRMMDYDASGNLVRTSSLWVPVDELTARFYERMSVGAFSLGSSSALATRSPSVDQQASLVRATYKDFGKTVMSPDDFEIVDSYVVTAESFAELTSDAFNATGDGPKPQDLKRTDSSSYPGDSVIRGYSLRLTADASENTGQIIFGPGQARLVCALADGTHEGFQAAAVITQASGSEVSASRYRFDARNVFIGTGRAADPVMTIEFVIPSDATPVDLLLKQARAPLDDLATAREMTVDERDDAVYSLELIGRSDEGPTGPRPEVLTSSGGPDENDEPLAGDISRELSAAGISQVNVVPGLTLSRQDRGSLSVDEEDNLIVRGDHTFLTADITGKRVPNELRVGGFKLPPSTGLLLIDVSINRRTSLLGRAVDAAERLLAPVLIDSNGQQYQAIGFVFGGGDRTRVRYEPGQPVRSMEELPALSRSRPTDKLILLFHVTSGVEVERFSLGGQRDVVAFDPPLVVR